VLKKVLKTPNIIIIAVSDHRRGEIPVPIPNTEVKPLHGVASTVLCTEKCAVADILLIFLKCDAELLL